MGLKIEIGDRQTDREKEREGEIKKEKRQIDRFDEITFRNAFLKLIAPF
jgi:hypothetical protein